MRDAAPSGQTGGVPLSTHAWLSKILFLAGVAFCVSPWADPPLALMLGFFISQSVGHPFLKYNGPLTKVLLQASVIGLGFGRRMKMCRSSGNRRAFGNLSIHRRCGCFAGLIRKDSFGLLMFHVLREENACALRGAPAKLSGQIGNPSFRERGFRAAIA
jgi:hypothetical protein